MAGKNDTIEILVAIFAVIFIFSLIGVLNLSDVAEQIAAPMQPAAAPQGTFLAGEVPEGLSDEELAAASGPAQESAPVSGTSLSPAVSHFSVEDGVQLSTGVTGLVVGELK